MSSQSAAEAGATHEAVWDKRIGPGETTAVAFDATGSLVVTGTIEGPLDASLNLPANDAGSGEWDGFVGAFDRAGMLLWLHRWRDASGRMSDAPLVSPSSVAIDADGVWVAGTAIGDAVDLDGTTLSVSYGGAFRVRYDRAGRLVSSTALPPPPTCDPSTCQAWSPAFDGDGPLVVLANDNTAPGPSTCNEWLTSFDAAGNAAWSRSVGDDGCPRVLAASRAGNVALLTTTGVAALGADGSPLWSQSMAPAVVRAMTFDSSGDLFVGGGFEGQIDLGGPTPLTSPGGASAPALFLAKYDSAGHYVFARAFGSTPGADGEIDAFRVADDGSFVFTGVFSGAVDFGQGLLGSSANPIGQRAIFMAKASPDGTVRSSRAFGSGPCDRGTSLDIAADGRIALGGVFNETLDFGAGPLSGATHACPAQFGADTDAFTTVLPPGAL